MCRTHIDGIGYICYDCKKEFKDANPELKNSRLIFEELSKFIKTNKGEYKDDYLNIDEFFDKNS